MLYTVRSWMVPGLRCKWRPSWEFSLINTPWAQEFSGSLVSWTQCSCPRDSGPISHWGIKIPQPFVMTIKGIKMKYKKNKQKNIKTNEPQTNDKCKIRQVEIKQGNIHRHTHKQNQNQNNPKKTRYKGVTLQV